MPQVFTRSDALQFSPYAAAIGLRAVGTIPGVRLVLPACRNGPGTGVLRSEGDGTLIAWRAPGSAVFGPAVDVAAGGAFLLEDGEDPGKFVTIEVSIAFLRSGPTEGRVFVRDKYDNDVADDDVTAAEAAAGDVSLHEVYMYNTASQPIFDVLVWLDPATSGLEISDDSGGPWVAPTTEATALGFGEIPVSGAKTLHLRRTISAGAGADPGVLNLLHACFDAEF